MQKLKKILVGTFIIFPFLFTIELAFLATFHPLVRRWPAYGT